VSWSFLFFLFVSLLYKEEAVFQPPLPLFELPGFFAFLLCVCALSQDSPTSLFDFGSGVKPSFFVNLTLNIPPPEIRQMEIKKEQIE